jgi:hypothetical protein
MTAQEQTNKRSWYFNVVVAALTLAGVHLAPLLLIQLFGLAFAISASFQAGVIEAFMLTTASDLDPSEIHETVKIALWAQGLFALVYGYLFLNSGSWALALLNGAVLIGGTYYWGGSWQRARMALFTK